MEVWRSPSFLGSTSIQPRVAENQKPLLSYHPCKSNLTGERSDDSAKSCPQQPGQRPHQACQTPGDSRATGGPC
jgi:hypothetical protein